MIDFIFVLSLMVLFAVLMFLWFLFMDYLWDRFVEPAVERYFARKKGWDEDWLRQAKERDWS